jgi:hypothetical protein
MKRYLLFAARDYYPDGGWRDFKGDFNSVEEALVQITGWFESKYLRTAWGWDTFWFQLVDTKTRRVIIEATEVRAEDQ